MRQQERQRAGVSLRTKYNTCPSARTGSASLNYHAGSLFTWFPAEGSHIPSGVDIAPGRAAEVSYQFGKSHHSTKINTTRENSHFLRGKVVIRPGKGNTRRRPASIRHEASPFKGPKLRKPEKIPANRGGF